VAAVAVIAGGLVLGLLIGRWWALVAPVAFAVWNYKTGRIDPFGAADISNGAAATVIGVWASVGVVVWVPSAVSPST
jgi:hypothetical protein